MATNNVKYITLEKHIAAYEKQNPITPQQHLENLLLRKLPRVKGAGSGNMGDLIYDPDEEKVYCYAFTTNSPDGEWVSIVQP